MRQQLRDLVSISTGPERLGLTLPIIALNDVERCPEPREPHFHSTASGATDVPSCDRPMSWRSRFPPIWTPSPPRFRRKTGPHRP